MTEDDIKAIRTAATKVGECREVFDKAKAKRDAAEEEYKGARERLKAAGAAYHKLIDGIDPGVLDIAKDG